MDEMNHDENNNNVKIASLSPRLSLSHTASLLLNSLVLPVPEAPSSTTTTTSVLFGEDEGVKGKGGYWLPEINAPAAVVAAATATTATCVVCYDTFNAAAGISCSLNGCNDGDEDWPHHSCEECFIMYLRNKLVSHDLRQNGEVQCVAHGDGGCPSAYRDNDIARICASHDSGMVSLWLDAREHLANRRGRKAALDEITESRRRCEEIALSEMALRDELRQQDGSFAALMCRTCKFGPVIREGCADLNAHHNETRARGAKVSNACKNCGWFSGQVADWLAWDGVFRSNDGSETTAATTTCESLEAKIRAMEAQHELTVRHSEEQLQAESRKILSLEQQLAARRGGRKRGIFRRLLCRGGANDVV